ncbi:hypothetical protein [Hasllibacter sp. MH4015]|uniref:hypothetical protein n=1 Tax=Hasllibacter sp. MH4015 TaxID=2854029 RepID=UPI001CD2E66B|nr:hypothetical protein [Hasllibacter sp. MH4015]
MAIANWIPVLVTLVGLVGGAIIYQIQKATDRKNQIRQERRELYRKLVVAVRELPRVLVYEDDEKIGREHAAFSALLGELLVCAPDNVVEGCGSLEDAVDDAVIARLEGGVSAFSKSDENHPSKIELALEKAVYEMRLDTFGDSKITKQMIAAMISGFEISIGVRIP